jgi:hypothetical protein
MEFPILWTLAKGLSKVLWLCGPKKYRFHLTKTTLGEFTESTFLISIVSGPQHNNVYTNTKSNRRQKPNHVCNMQA